MGQIVSLGGNRLGSGNKMKVAMHGYERSNQNLSTIRRTTMAPGVLVPIYTNIYLNGDTFDIDILNIIKTLPTNGPIFGSFKLQIDVFTAPIRLYNGLLHNNKKGVGLQMDKVKIPQLITWHNLSGITNNNISNSSLLAYCGIRQFGKRTKEDDINYSIFNQSQALQQFNGLPILAYYDIFKNYYANQQEENFYLIGKKQEDGLLFSCRYDTTSGNATTWHIDKPYVNEQNWDKTYVGTGDLFLIFENTQDQMAFYNCIMDDNAYIKTTTEIWSIKTNFTVETTMAATTNANDLIQSELKPAIKLTLPIGTNIKQIKWNGGHFIYMNSEESTHNIKWIHAFENNKYRNTTKLKAYPLEMIDILREWLLTTKLDETQYLANGDFQSFMNQNYPGFENANDFLDEIAGEDDWGQNYSITPQCGLVVKTYQSDCFNNWLNKETIEGQNGINAISAVSTADGKFTIDALNLAQKVYNMLNRIAVSGGTYQDWQEAVWDVEATKHVETPIYWGGMSSEIEFGEVVSTSDTETTAQGNQPLGSLAGRGYSKNGNDSGKIVVKPGEPSVIMIMCSITPRIEYSQGNRWYMTELKSMNDLHKPELDEIGFQDLMSPTMLGCTTRLKEIGQTGDYTEDTDQIAIGKQPAWLQYTTDYNECFGDFADENKAMYMTLNRRYQENEPEDFGPDNVQKLNKKIFKKMFWQGIKDATTYIDPAKFNYAFADTALEAQNFWVQIGLVIEARRKMSARLIPNI